MKKINAEANKPGSLVCLVLPAALERLDGRPQPLVREVQQELGCELQCPKLQGILHLRSSSSSSTKNRICSSIACIA
jgi:hypothetical protein